LRVNPLPALKPHDREKKPGPPTAEKMRENAEFFIFPGREVNCDARHLRKSLKNLRLS